MAVIKRFLEWIQLKEKLHQVRKGPPQVYEGDLWWISFGENIGAEINGKSGLFSRPGLILKKLSREFYLVAPSTTRPKKGSWFYKVNHEGVDMHFCLHQIRTIDYRRISNRLGMVGDKDFERIKAVFWNLYK